MKNLDEYWMGSLYDTYLDTKIGASIAIRENAKRIFHFRFLMIYAYVYGRNVCTYSRNWFRKGSEELTVIVKNNILLRTTIPNKWIIALQSCCDKQRGILGYIKIYINTFIDDKLKLVAFIPEDAIDLYGSRDGDIPGNMTYDKWDSFEQHLNSITLKPGDHVFIETHSYSHEDEEDKLKELKRNRRVKKRSCIHCGVTEASTSPSKVKLKRCKKYKDIWYCSDDCQILHHAMYKHLGSPHDTVGYGVLVDEHTLDLLLRS